MGEEWGVLAAVLSSGLGGTSIGATRYLVNAVDPLAIGSFRFGIGFLLLLPVAVLKSDRWPVRRDWLGVISLGVLFFALFPILFNASLIFTTAARGALALSTLPLLTMVVGAALGSEVLTRAQIRWRAGRDARRGPGSSRRPRLGASRSLARRSPDGRRCLVHGVLQHLVEALHRSLRPCRLTTMSMGVGAACLILISCWRGSFTPVAFFGASQWLAAAYLGAFGSALTFYLWAFALERTTPTRVAISVTVNPVTASLVGAALLHEPLHWNLIGGIMTVFAGIWIATTAGRHPETMSGIASSDD